MPRAQFSLSSRSSETITMTSPTIPKKTTNDEIIANHSHGAEDPSKVFKELSSAEIELFKADMEAANAEESLGRAEATAAKYCGIATIALLCLLAAIIGVLILTLRRNSVHK